MRFQEILTKIVIFLAVLAVASYAGLKIYSLFSGPKIEIYYPKNGEVVDSVFTITGRVQRADKIYLFDREIWTDQDGYFKEKMVSSNNYTDIIIKASNRWSKENEVKLTVENIENTRK